MSKSTFIQRHPWLSFGALSVLGLVLYMEAGIRKEQAKGLY